MRRTWLLAALAFCSACPDDPGGEDPTSGSSEAAEEGPVGKPGCAEGEPEFDYRPDMVGCPGRVTQCEAETLCAEGWHLCKFIEFEMMGGIDEPSADQYWLASCVREGGPNPPFCPTQDICSSACDATVSVQEVDITFECNMEVESSSTNAPLGVTTSPDPVARLNGCPGSVCIHGDVAGTNSAFGALCCAD